MGKKRKEVVEDDPPEHATANEKKKTRVANYGQLSTETLLNKEQEVTRELVELQTELSHMRSNSATSYGNNQLRQMNTKRYRAEYALGEIKAEIERRARKKLGQAIPQGGIQGGSTAGVAATTTTNQDHEKTRRVNAACSSVLAESLRDEGKGKSHGKSDRQGGGVLRDGGGGGVLKDPSGGFGPMPAGGGVLRDPSGGGVLNDPSGSFGPMPNGGGVLRDPSGGSSTVPQFDRSMFQQFQQFGGSSASVPGQMPPQMQTMPAPAPSAAPQIVNPMMAMMGSGASNAMGAMNAMAMMGAMGGAGGMASLGPTPQEMAQASMQFQQMFSGQQPSMQQFFSGQPMGQANMMSNVPAAFASSSNVPAAFAKRVNQS